MEEPLKTVRSVDEGLNVHKDAVHHLKKLGGRIIRRRRREPVQGLFHHPERRVGFFTKCGQSLEGRVRIESDLEGS